MNYMQRYERFTDIVEAVKFRDWQIEHSIVGGTGWAVRVIFNALDMRTGIMGEQAGRLWLIEPDSSESQIVFTCWLAIMTALEHEAREDFTYEGKRILNPHVSVQALKGLGVDERFRD